MGDDTSKGSKGVASDSRAGVRRGDFEASALFDALDRLRIERAMSWREVADSIWAQSFELNERRNDHPIAVATITGMTRRNNISCQHALFMLRWVGRAPEEFIVDPVPNVGECGLPIAGPDRRLRWNLGALHEAMNDRRRGEHLTWQSLSEALGCTPSQLTGIKTARFATGMRLAMRITQWLGRPAANFVYAARW